jgi:hypothetical protein
VKRIAALAATMAALLLVFAVSEGGGLEAPKSAEAASTTWIYPIAPATYTVPGGNQALEATEFFLTPPCTNCWITRIEPDLIYQQDPNHTNGTVANYNNNNTTDGVWLHHFVILDSCNLTNRIISSGNERTILQNPPGYGYYQAAICPDSSPGTWTLNFHIHNSGINQRKVAIRLQVTYQTTPLSSAVPVWLDVSANANSEYIVCYPQNPPQPTCPSTYNDKHTGDSGMHADYTMSVQGRIIGMGGHVHDYGYSVSAFNTGAGDRPDDWICTSVAGYGSGSVYLPTGGPGTPGHPAAANAETLKAGYAQEGPPANRNHIQSMTPCSISARMSVICVGDVIRLHTQYNNTSGFPISDAMGIMVMYVATPPLVPDADSDGTWDGCDASDTDGDTFPDRVEASATTLANDPCGANAWPPDIDNSTFVDIVGDISVVASNFGTMVPPAPDRQDIGPNPTDGVVDVIGDISRMAGLFGLGCTP